jgi:Membrane dipeptidase (Peptidase family M19)
VGVLLAGANELFGVDHLFESYPDRALTAEQLRAAIARYNDLGVRYVFPIHFNNNLFGGTAFQNGLQVDPQYPGNGPINPVGTLPASPVPTIPDASLGYEYRTGRRNPIGLSDLGKLLIRELISRGMLFDVDHMCHQAHSDALDIAEAAGYPVFSGHSGFIDVCRVTSAWRRSRPRRRSSGSAAWAA